jgi:hypothetical protein
MQGLRRKTQAWQICDERILGPSGYLTTIRALNLAYEKGRIAADAAFF